MSGYTNGDTLWSYSLSGIRTPEDDVVIDAINNFSGNQNNFGIISLDWDSTNDQLYGLVHQKRSAAEIRIDRGEKKLATIGLDLINNVTWSTIPDQYVMRGGSLDLKPFALNGSSIIFGEGYTPIDWLTLNNGILSISDTGVPAGVTSLSIPLIGIGRGNPSFTILRLMVITPAVPKWSVIPPLTIDRDSRIDLHRYVTGATHITGVNLPYGLTFDVSGILTIPETISAVTTDITTPIQLRASNSIGSADTSFTLTILNSSVALKELSYRDNHIIWQVEIGETDISDDVTEINNIRHNLDIVITGEFTVAECTLRISNGQQRYQQGGSFWEDLPALYNTPVIVRAGYRDGNTDTLIRVFSGVIESIREIQDDQYVSILCIDESATLRDAYIDNLGVEKRNIQLGTGRLDIHGQYDIPEGLTPISDKSLTGISGGRPLQVVADQELNILGNFNPYKAKSTENILETEGGLLDEEPIVDVKAPYSYLTQKDLLHHLLNHFDIHNIEIDQELAQINRTSSTTLSQSLGRIGYNAEITNIVRYAKDVISGNNRLYILSGSPYIGESDYLWQFDRNTDTWTILAYFSSSDETWQITSRNYQQFFVMATSKRDDIDVIPNGTYDSSEGTTENPSLVKILEVDTTTGTISTLVDGSNQYPPQLAHFYAVGFPRENASSTRYGKLPDNRAGFQMAPGIAALYYRYASATEYGVAQVNTRGSSKGSTRSVMRPNATPNSFGSATSFCFCMSTQNNVPYMYLAYSSGSSSTSSLRIIGAQPTSTPQHIVTALAEPTTGLNRYAFVGALEMNVSGAYLYIVVQKQPKDVNGNRLEYENSTATLYSIHLRLDVSNRRFTAIKEYDYVQLAARSFTEHDGKVYCFEGSHYAYKFQFNIPLLPGVPLTETRDILPPNIWKREIGRLYELEETRMTDLGFIWRSQLATSGTANDSYYGIHGGTASPMISMNDELFIIPGYGNWDNIGILPNADINQVDNVSLITYGNKIDNRLPMLETNGANGYDILQQMAQSANATFGMTSSSFFFKSRKEPRPLLQSGLSQTDTTITVSNATESAYSGLLLINNEVISYTNRNNTQFLGITRAIPPSQPATHNANTIVFGIDHLLDANSVNSPILQWIATDDKENLYNVVNVNYGRFGLYGKR